jgi:hypothetical protein
MYTGVYINLERNEKRRASMDRHLKDIGASSRYEWFPAIDGRTVLDNHPTAMRPGALGLWLTVECILEAFEGLDQHLHILEDDVVLARNGPALFEQALEYADKELRGWDLLFTETLVPFDAFRVYSDLLEQYGRTKQHAYLDLSSLYQACMSSFFVNKASLGKIANLMKGKWSLGAPKDMYVRQLIRQKQLKAYVTVPFMTSISAESDTSDIRGELDLSHRVCDVFRRGFFQEADLVALRREMKLLTEGTTVTPLAGLYLDAMTFRLSSRWVRF